MVEQMQALPIPNDKKGRTYGDLYTKTQFNKIIDEIDNAEVREFNQSQAKAEIQTKDLIQEWQQSVGEQFTDEQLNEFEDRLKSFRAQHGLYGPIRELEALKKDTVFNFDAAERADQVARLQVLQEQGRLTVAIVNTYPEEIARQFRSIAQQQENQHTSSVKPKFKHIEQAVKGLDGIRLIGGQEMSGRAGMIADHYKEVFRLRTQAILRGNPSPDINQATEQAYKEFEIQLQQDTTNPEHPFFLSTNANKGFGFINYNKPESTRGLTIKTNGELNHINSVAKAMPGSYLDSPGLFGSKADFEGWAQNYGQPGWRFPTKIARWAAYHEKSPLEIMNRQMIAHDLPPLPNVEQILEQRKQLSPEYRRLLDKLFMGTATTNQFNRLTGAPVPVRSTIASVVPSSMAARFRSAIISQESGGSYTILGQYVPGQGRAIGIGQVMPANVGPWTKKYVGRAMSPNEFRYNPAAQDKVLNGMFNDMLTNNLAAGYSEEEAVRRAAAEWYGGPGAVEHWNNPGYKGAFANHPNMQQYTRSIWRKYSGSK